MSNVDENVFYKQIIDLDNPLAKHDLVIQCEENFKYKSCNKLNCKPKSDK